MVLLNYPPGALGFLVLNAAYLHWPSDPTIRARLYTSVGSTNHHARPDLFLGDQTTIQTEEIRQLEDLFSAPSVVLCHKKEILPEQLLERARRHAKIACIDCPDVASKIQSMFLYWVKAADDAFLYVKNQQGHSDFYQSMYQQLLAQISRPRSLPEGIIMEFPSLSDYDAILPWVQEIQSEFCLPPRTDQGFRYQNLYQTSVSALDDFKKEYEMFRDIWLEITEHGIFDRCDYRDILSTASVKKFTHVMDFFRKFYPYI